MQRNTVLGSEKKVLSSFEVISINANLKLLHSLVHLHSISGSHFAPDLPGLVKMSLGHFHLITK